MNIAWYHLYVESKKVKFRVTEIRIAVSRGESVRKWGDSGQRVETYKYTMTKF
jgi:hypothetical protein